MPDDKIFAFVLMPFHEDFDDIYKLELVGRNSLRIAPKLNLSFGVLRFTNTTYKI